MKQMDSLGFTTVESEDKQADDFNRMRDKVLQEVKKVLKPEFYNRIDDVVVFHALKEEHLKDIIDLLLNDLRKRLAELGFELEVDDSAKKHLAKVGYDLDYGARPLKRAIQTEIENPLSDALLRKTYQEGSQIKVTCEDDKIVLA